MARRKLLLVFLVAFAIGGVVVNAALYFFPQPIALFIINARAGCWPWSPRVVEFRQGMTICPGQAATIRVPLMLPREPAPRI